MRLNFIFALVGVTLFFTSCNQPISSDTTIIATVDDKHLLQTELEQMIPKGIPKQDSARRANDYIQRWVKRELMLHRAEENLAPEAMNVQHELEEYRAQLLIHRYQQELVNQRLDTVFTDEDFRQYYNENPEKFILNKAIIRGIYLEVPSQVANSEKVKEWMKLQTPEAASELEVYSFQYATKFDYFIEEWFDFSMFKPRLPMKIKDSEQFLKHNNYLEVADSLKVYYLSIKEFKLPGEKAPFIFVKDQIENLILNSRKLELIQDLERSVYEKGLEENLFTINQEH